MRLLPILISLAAAIPALAADAPVPPPGMVYVPAGAFIMGNNRTDPTDFNQRDNVGLAYNDARPQHEAQTGAFFIDITEVTNAQYAKFCAATNVPVPPHWANGKFAEGEADFPVHHVNWFEATAYAKWIKKRLPTELEWEKTARGTDGRRFPWGNDWDNSKVSGVDGVVAVGKYPQGVSPYGALDMAGNIAEWTSSWWNAYPGSPTKQRDFGASLKVVRGGAWIVGEMLNQSFYREVSRPRSRIAMVGFRCARDAENAR